MKELLAGIADYTAKGIYAVIHWYGTATTQDLYDAKYKEGTILKAANLLEKLGYIERQAKGIYRDRNFTRMKYNFTRVQFEETSSECATTSLG
jgi:hypothetical protein